MRPAPKNVASMRAHAGATVLVGVSLVAASDVSVVIVTPQLVPERTIIDIFQRRRNHILPARPFAKVDQSAPFAAKREILGRTLHRLLASGALQLGFSSLCHRL